MIQIGFILWVLSLSWACGKNSQIYSLFVYCVNFILYCSALTLLTVGMISAYSVMKQWEPKKRGRERKKTEKIQFHILGDEEQGEPKKRRSNKQMKNIKVQIDWATTMLVIGTCCRVSDSGGIQFYCTSYLCTVCSIPITVCEFFNFVRVGYEFN